MGPSIDQMSDETDWLADFDEFEAAWQTTDPAERPEEPQATQERWTPYEKAQFDLGVGWARQTSRRTTPAPDPAVLFR